MIYCHQILFYQKQFKYGMNIGVVNIVAQIRGGALLDFYEEKLPLNISGRRYLQFLK